MAMVEQSGASERFIRRYCQRFYFAAVASGLLLFACSSSLSQTYKVIGVLSPFIDTQSTFASDLRAGLAEHGLHEGWGIKIEYRSAEGHVDRLPELARELVKLNVDVIVTASAPAIRFVQQATKTIPIVMAGVGDAVDQGFIQNLAHPGGNVTGISLLAPELSAKRLELLKQALPAVNRVGILREASASASSVLAVRAAAQTLGIVPSIFEVRDAAEFPTALAAMVEARVDAVEILEGLMIFNNVRALVTLTEACRMPTIFPDFGFVEAGGLMSYGPDFREIHRRTADMVVKILKGVPPSNIPVEQPTKFVFAINLKSAKALALTIDPVALLRADLLVD